MKFTTTAIAMALAALPAVLAQSTSGVVGVSCGGTEYSADDVQGAADAALQYVESGQQVHKYPHQEYDYEGIPFDCSSPYYEFPIFAGQVYSGGSPGADRVVIGSIADDGSSAQFCAAVTHTGASGNNFVACDNLSQKIRDIVNKTLRERRAERLARKST